MSQPTQTPDFSTIKTRQRQTWAAGDYQIIASIIQPIAEQLCDTVDLRAGQRVLDVATGTGNSAIAAARRLCAVTGVDFVPALLDRGRERAAAEGLSVTFVEGDAEALADEDGAFDVVLSAFGVMFAPNQEQAARELLRVTRAGGRIGLANWTPDGWIGEMLTVVGRHVPPPAGIRAVTRWGTEAGVRELLAHGVRSLQTNRRVFVWRFESAEQYLHLFRTYYGPTVKAYAALNESGRRALTSDLLDVLGGHARRTGGTLLVPAEYLEVIADTAI